MISYDNIRITRDDLSPMLEDNADIVTLTLELCNKNCPVEVILWELSEISGVKNLTWQEVKQFIHDAKGNGKFPEIAVVGDSIPDPVVRPARVTGLGINTATGGVWTSAPAAEFTLRFYVNAALKTTLVNYNFTDLVTLGAVSGDVIQVCQTVDGVVGWWSRKVVP